MAVSADGLVRLGPVVVSAAEQAAADAAEASAITAFVTGGEAEATVVVAGAVLAPADVVACIVVAVILIIALAGPWLVKGLAWLLGHLPLVGGWVQDHLNEFGDAWWNFDVSAARWSIDSAMALLRWAANLVFGPIHVLGRAVELVANHLHWVETGVIPWYWQQTIARISSSVDSAVNTAEAFTNAAIGALHAQVLTLYYDAIAHSNAAWAHADAAAHAALTESVGYAQQVYQEVEHDLHGAEVQWQYQLQQLALQTAGQINLEHGSMLATAAGVLTTAERDLGTVKAQLQTQVQQLSDELRNEVETCVEPMCETVGKDAQQLLGLLQGAGNLLVFAYLAAAIRDPQPVADDTVAVLSPVVERGGALLDDLVAAVA